MNVLTARQQAVVDPAIGQAERQFPATIPDDMAPLALQSAFIQGALWAASALTLPEVRKLPTASVVATADDIRYVRLINGKWGGRLRGASRRRGFSTPNIPTNPSRCCTSQGVTHEHQEAVHSLRF